MQAAVLKSCAPRAGSPLVVEIVTPAGTGVSGTAHFGIRSRGYVAVPAACITGVAAGGLACSAAGVVAPVDGATRDTGAVFLPVSAPGAGAAAGAGAAPKAGPVC